MFHCVFFVASWACLRCKGKGDRFLYSSVYRTNGASTSLILLREASCFFISFSSLLWTFELWKHLYAGHPSNPSMGSLWSVGLPELLQFSCFSHFLTFPEYVICLEWSAVNLSAFCAAFTVILFISVSKLGRPHSSRSASTGVAKYWLVTWRKALFCALSSFSLWDFVVQGSQAKPA